MCNFLKTFVLDAFEICKAKLKGDDKLEIAFYLYSFSKMRLSSSFKDYATRNTQSPALI